MMIILIVLIVLFFAALVFLYKKSRICDFQKKQIEELQQKIVGFQESLEKEEKNRETIWDAANTIHLYASLSEEEAKSQEYRQKQSEIKKLSEMIIKCFDTP